MSAHLSLRLRLLAIASLSLPACSDSPDPAASGGAAGTTAEAGTGGSPAQGGAGQGGAGASGTGEGGAGQGGAGQGGAGPSGAGAGGAGQGGVGVAGQGGVGQSGAGQGGAPDKCEALHPTVGKGGSGGGSQALPRTTESCYQPSPEEQKVGCLPRNSPQLLDLKHLNHPLTGCGYVALSVHSEATKTVLGSCDVLMDCCFALPTTEREMCLQTTKDQDESACAASLVDPAYACQPEAIPNETFICCYEACTSVTCPGRPLVVEQGVRLAALHRVSDAGWG